MTAEQLGETTRGRILVLLARAPRTAGALAERLDISPNGVRQHLAALERDGAVERAGTVSTGGKPAALFRLSAGGDAAFPKAYAEVLAALADELADQLEPADAERLFTAAGIRLARVVAGEDPRSADDAAAARLEAAIDALTVLGALADVERRDDGSLLLEGHACPLSDVVTERPLLCHMLAMMTEHIAGLEVEHRCDYSGIRPRCRFRIAAAA